MTDIYGGSNLNINGASGDNPELTEPVTTIPDRPARSATARMLSRRARRWCAAVRRVGLAGIFIPASP